jgi:hypothetical protein
MGGQTVGPHAVGDAGHSDFSRPPRRVFLHSPASSAQSADLFFIVHRMGSTVLILNGSIIARTGIMPPD